MKPDDRDIPTTKEMLTKVIFGVVDSLIKVKRLRQALYGKDADDPWKKVEEKNKKLQEK